MTGKGQRAKGNRRERGVALILASWGVLAWKPRNAALRLPPRAGRPATFISHPQDILGCLDLEGVRSDLPVIGIQVGDVANGAHKKRQVETGIGGHYLSGSRLEASLLVSVWLWDPAARVYWVWDAAGGAAGAPGLLWTKIGSVRSNGEVQLLPPPPGGIPGGVSSLGLLVPPAP